MTLKIKPAELKKLRKSRGLSVEQAALAVNRSVKSWRDYESVTAKPEIPADIFKLFLWTFRITWPNAKVISIAAYKGGIGKSPITVTLAAYLAQIGLKIAVVTSDEVFRTYSNQEKAAVKVSDCLTSKVDFYDELDVVLYPGEVMRLEEEEIHRQQTPEANRYFEDIETLARKKATSIKFEELKNDYDLIFLDLNRNLTQTLLRSDEIVLLVDSTCPYSPGSTRSFYEQMTRLNKDKLESIHVLLTNFSATPRLKGQIDVRRAHKNKVFDSCMFDSHLTLKTYKEIRKLSIPMMRSRFTGDYEFHIDLYESNPEVDDLCYFNTILDIAPNSIAAMEVEQVSDELAEILWGMNCRTPAFFFTTSP